MGVVCVTPIQTGGPAGLFPKLVYSTAHLSLQKRARAAIQLKS
jgi:hypothetical protein